MLAMSREGAAAQLLARALGLLSARSDDPSAMRHYAHHFRDAPPAAGGMVAGTTLLRRDVTACGRSGRR